MVTNTKPPNLRANPHTCIGCKHGVEAYDGEAYCEKYKAYTEGTDVCDDWTKED